MEYMREKFVQPESEQQAEKEKPEAELLSEKLKTAAEEKEHGKPALSVDIFYSAHDTPKDFEKLADFLPQADVYIPECIGWSSVDQAHYDAISESRKTPEEIIEHLKGTTPDMYPPHDTKLKEFEILYNSHKPITFIDIPLSHPLTQRFNALDAAFLEQLTGHFEDDLESYKNFLKQLAQFQTEREEYLLSQFKPRVAELLQNHPGLKEKAEIKVLVTLGSIHTPVWHFLKKSGQKTATFFKTKPHMFSHENEAIRRNMFNNEVNDELVARAYLESEFFAHFTPARNEDTEKLAVLMRNVIDQFSVSDIKNVFDKVEQGNDFIDTFRAACQVKNIQLETKEQFNKLFEK